MPETIPQPKDRWELPVPFGVYADNGQVLEGLDEAAFAAFSQYEQERRGSNEHQALKAKAQGSEADYGVSAAEVDDPNDLTETGWAVLFSPSAGAEIQQALEPLLKLRREQAGDLFKIFQGEDGFVASDQDAYGWLKRYQLNLDQPVNPRSGIPYYLLIVAPPEEISFEFQYTLDIQWAVGRIWFPDAAEFRRYAESVVRYESADDVTTSRQVAVFAPEHEFDRATQLFTRHVAKPLVNGADPIGRKRKYGLQAFLGEDATRETLHRIWSGSLEHGPPALLFSGGHGMAFRAGDPAQESSQGAIVCQDWEGYPLRREDYYTASDLPAAAKIHGLVHFFFACYGAGWPHFDNFSREKKEPVTIAPKPMLARLPQALLAHPNGGALAVIGHVDRAWAYSFQSSDNVAQIDSFRDATARILRGERLGNAMDQFNIRWATLSEKLAELQYEWSLRDATDSDFETQKAKQISTQWVARDDARNYIVFGDPAVQLRVKDMPAL